MIVPNTFLQVVTRFLSYFGPHKLVAAVAISIFLHAIPLSTHFAFPDAALKKQQSLDIILVNSKSAQRPTHALAKAQANLDGGGNTDENRRVKTPLPTTAQQQNGNEVEQLQKKVRDLEKQQQGLLTQTRSKDLRPADKGNKEEAPVAPTLSGLDLAETARAMARLEGEISKNVEEYNKRPRKKFIGASTVETHYAAYLDAWRTKIEKIGTLNYPDAARGKVYGSLILTVSINADGSINRVDINRSSGYKVLDDAARRIVQLGAPYAPFPPGIRQDTDIIEITRTWYFTQGDQLSAK